MKEHLLWKFLKNSFIHCPNQKCTRLSWSVSRNLTDISVLDKPQLFAVEPCKHLHMCVAPLLLTILFCSTIYSALTHSTTIATSYCTWSQALSASNTCCLLMMSSLGPSRDVEVSWGMIKGPNLSTRIMLSTPKLAAQIRCTCFWRKSVRGDLAAVPDAVPTVWVSVAEKEEDGYKLGS